MNAIELVVIYFCAEKPSQIGLCGGLGASKRLIVFTAMVPLRLNRGKAISSDHLVSERAIYWLEYLKAQESSGGGCAQSGRSKYAANVRSDTRLFSQSGIADSPAQLPQENITNQLRRKSQELAEVELWREIQRVDHQLIQFRTQRQIEYERRNHEEELSMLRQKLADISLNKKTSENKPRSISRAPSALALASRAISRGRSR